MKYLLVFVMIFSSSLYSQERDLKEIFMSEIPTGTSFIFKPNEILNKRKTCKDSKRVYLANGALRCTGPLFQRVCALDSGFNKDKYPDKMECVVETSCMEIKGLLKTREIKFTDPDCPNISCLRAFNDFRGDMDLASLKYNLGDFVSFKLKETIDSNAYCVDSSERTIKKVPLDGSNKIKSIRINKN